ncbi:MAG: AglZ/HisF2 family acetamidino modification protein [Bacteroidota bacterium]
MRWPRIIPVLLLNKGGLYKTLKFKEPVYVGDPLNAVKIFNEKEVDEITVLDIHASSEGRKPDLEYLSMIASECFMPLSYGGGINSIDDIKSVTKTGIEKIVINTAAIENPQFIQQAAGIFGSTTIVVSIDVKKNWLGKYEVYNKNKRKIFTTDPLKMAEEMNKCGAGELLLNAVDRDGTMLGYDRELIRKISSSVDIPVVACGGAGNLQHLKEAYQSGASAMAAGSLFVFRGTRQSVLINYPSQKEIKELFR